MRHAAILIFLAGLLSGTAHAQLTVWPDRLDTRVCPAADGQSSPPDFEDPACEARPIEGIDPQGRLLWVRLTLHVTADDIAALRPAGLFVSAKASSAAYLNGRLLGRNGRPASRAQAEVPGRMDAVFFVPPEVLREGPNTLSLLMSAHHGFIRLDHPIHFAALAPYGDPTRARLSGYVPALMTFGALLIGAVYFGAVAARGGAPAGSFALSAGAAAAAAQLVAEVWRGLFAYPYPVHDIRLVLIVVFSALAGSALALFAWGRVYRRGHRVFLACVLGFAGAAALLARGFDLKAVIALLVPLVLAIGALAVDLCRRRRRRRALAPLALLSAFVAVVLLAPGQFLDRFFFQLMAALLFALFVQQAFHLARESRRRREEEGRAQRLEVALARAREQRMPTRLRVVSAGRVDLIEAEAILRCQGAGDYVELHLAGGACLLHDGTLNGLDDALPPTFLRVHRSHIVNTNHIAALDRDSTGVGALTLTDGTRVPVSRRIMPRVRSALKGAALSPAG